MSKPDWLKKPEPVKDPVVYVSIPEGAKLSSAISAALSELGKSLQEAAEDKVSPKRGCLPYSCTLNQCHPYSRVPCYVFLTCHIIEEG